MLETIISYVVCYSVAFGLGMLAGVLVSYVVEKCWP